LFAGKCIEILSDRKLLASMSAAAKKKVETKFSSARMADDYFHLYKGLSAEKKQKWRWC
jgi:glycosyltransferase involved in cell wall biosynthesis